MSPSLSLAYSTCPNDTFIFHAMAHGLVDCCGLSYNTTLEDVETLNLNAIEQRYDITKLSFAALGFLHNSYGLLRTGAALGRGCGPLIVARSGAAINQMKSALIAIPGEHTTANLLLGLFLKDQLNFKTPLATAMTFDQIMPAICERQVDFGVIIHEGRFTYQNYDLVSIADLGQWWEQKTALPIPLGAIAIRRDLPEHVKKTVENTIGASVRFAFNHKDAAGDYIKQYAAEMSETVIKQHIELYVNSFSSDLGEEGGSSVNRLFKMAHQADLLPDSNAPLWACKA